MRKSTSQEVHKFFTTRYFRALRGISLLLVALALPVPAWPATALAAGASPAIADDFTLPTANGKVTLSALRGKVVLVDFWASWCVPCRQSFPWMKTLAERYATSGLVVVAIDLDKNRELADTFLREFAPGFVVAFDPAGTSAETYAVTTMPSSFLVGRDGRLVYSHAGFDPRDAEKIEQQVQEVIAK